MWRSPEELTMIGFSRSRVVMMNECHDGFLRCRRTREIGLQSSPILAGRLSSAAKLIRVQTTAV